MKITNNVDYKSYNNSLHNIDMGLDVSKTDSIMTLLRNSIYSNPIESFVREIYSNAIDAHLKSGIELPIKVTIELSEKEDCVNSLWFDVKTTEELISLLQKLEKILRDLVMLYCSNYER